MYLRLSLQMLKLSVCHRCPQSHVREAQKYNPIIEPDPKNPEGVIGRDISQDEALSDVKMGIYSFRFF